MSTAPVRYYLKNYQAVMAKRFFTHGGGIFVNEGRNTATRIANRLKNDSRPICHAENEHNHYHFDFEFSRDRWSNFLKNRAFAEAAKMAWDETLRNRKEQRAYELFVCNRLTTAESTPPHATVAYHIFPTISLWTKGPGTKVLDEIFCVDQLDYDLVWQHDDDSGHSKLISLSEAQALVELPPWPVKADD